MSRKFIDCNRNRNIQINFWQQNFTLMFRHFPILCVENVLKMSEKEATIRLECQKYTQNLIKL